MQKLDDICWESSSHDDIYKKVLYRQDSFKSNITQVAYTELLAGEEIPIHCHSTMEELFFLTNGVCEIRIDDEKYLAESQTVLRIPANARHSLKAITNCSLFYIGVSI